MPRAKKKPNGHGSNGMTAKQMKRRKPIDKSLMTEIKPLTDNQKTAFDEYKAGKNLLLHGAAGTGKTFISLYLALKDVLSDDSPYEKIYICLLYTSPSPRD